MFRPSLLAGLATVIVTLAFASESLASDSQPPVASVAPVTAPEADSAPKTLFGGSRRVVLGGFGGIDAVYSRVNGADAAMACAQGGLLVNHVFSVGLGGCGVANRLEAPTESSGSDRLNFGYGGLIARYHVIQLDALSLSLGTLVGGGGVYVGKRWDSDGEDSAERKHDSLFVVQPELGLHLNLTRWMRVSGQVGYRAVAGVDTAHLSDAKLSGLIAGGGLQFGWF